MTLWGNSGGFKTKKNIWQLPHADSGPTQGLANIAQFNLTHVKL